MEERARYSIGETSLITGISSKTLRYYDSLNLVIPEIRGPQNNYRYYSNDQVVRLLAVQRLRLMGCSQQKLRTLIQENSLDALCSQIELRIRELEKEIANQTRIINENREFLNRLKASMAFSAHANDQRKNILDNIQIEEIKKIYIFSEERVMPNYNVCSTSINFRLDLYKKCEELGLKPLGPEITTYFTSLLGQFSAQDCKIRIGIVIGSRDNYEQIQEFGGFTAATAIHYGSYDTMVNTHMMMLRWISQHGFEVTGHVSEEFMMSPIDILDQENQIIKVIIPIKKP